MLKALFYKALGATFEILTKNSTFYLRSSIQKYGRQNDLQRYKCPHCNKTFTFKSKLYPDQIWLDYFIGKQTQ